MKVQNRMLTMFMALLVGLVFCGVPECVQALPQQATPQQQNGTTIDPSQGPLQPVPTQNQTNQAQPNTEIPPSPVEATPAPQPKPEPQMQEPLGTATAEGVPTVGGGASRPAGAAIAPAKQNQRRSLLLKIGAIAAAGVAAGAIYGLSKGTPSRPPAH